MDVMVDLCAVDSIVRQGEDRTLICMMSGESMCVEMDFDEIARALEGLEKK
jgi:hypothetical protein